MIKVLAHRGYSSKYPENSLLAFKKAFEVNSDGIECDIQKTNDNKFIVFHDDKLDRLTNKKGLIKNLTYTEIKEIKQQGNQNILLLEDLLKTIPENKIINIELKKETLSKDDCPEIHKILKKYKNKIEIIISSFSYKLLIFFIKENYLTGYLFGQDFLDYHLLKKLNILLKIKNSYLNIPIKLFEILNNKRSYKILKYFKLFKKKMIFWVINNERDLKKIYKYSNMIITDNPEYLLKIKADRGLK